MADAQLSDAEWKVMHAVWSRRGAVTVRAVVDVVSEETAWAYSTVKTLMERLAEKGALRVRKAGIAMEYRSALPRRRAQRAALRDLMRKAFGGAMSPMAHSLLDAEQLSEADRKELLRKLTALERDG